MNSTNIIIPKKNRTCLPVILLCGLLFLRIPFVILSYALKISNPVWQSIFIILTYLLTAILIWVERDRLEDFHIGLGAVAIIITMPVLRPIICSIIQYSEFSSGIGYTWVQFLYMQLMLLHTWIEIPIAIILLAVLLLSHTNFKKKQFLKTLMWLIIAIITGIILGFLQTYLRGFVGIYFKENYKEINNRTYQFRDIISSFLTQLSIAAIAEEPLFRGLLWGYLKKANWKEVWIWIFQGLLFLSGHFYYFRTYKYSFTWVLISGLTFGLIAWRSKNITNSMITHAIMNSQSYIFNIIVRL